MKEFYRGMASVGKWAQLPDVIESGQSIPVMEYLFKGIDIFQYYAKISAMASNGTVSESVLQFGFSAADLGAYFREIYDERFFYLDYEPENLSYNLFPLLRLKNKIAQVYRMNKHKYLKTIETLAYTYNPIENVDEVTIWADFEADGGKVTTRTISGKMKDETKNYSELVVTAEAGVDGGDGPTTTTKVSPDDTTSFVNAEEVSQSGGTTTTTSGDGDKNKQIHERTYENYEDKLEETHTQTELDVSATDNPYGQDVSNVDRLTGHKTRRHGNIGVTSSQSLILETLDLELRNNAVQQFFDDIDKVVLLQMYIV